MVGPSEGSSLDHRASLPPLAGGASSIGLASLSGARAPGRAAARAEVFSARTAGSPPSRAPRTQPLQPRGLLRLALRACRARIAQSALVFIVLFELCVPALASDTGLSGREGHPRARFPLTVWAPPLGDARLDAVLRRAVDDWNTVFREALGRQAFAWGERRETAQVTLLVEPSTSPNRMGETYVRAEDTGVIALPVRIVVFEPTPRGQSSRETLLYQIAAHELGHTLGLVHARDPRSLMCCVPGSVDFNDPVAREAYIEARRHPEVGTVRAQLVEHYGRFWRERD